MALDEAARSDARVLRKVLERELETINAYEDFIDQLVSPELKRVVEHIRDEEKEHVAETLHFIRQLDPAQEAVFQRGIESMLKRDEGAPSAPAGPPPLRLTVGSLRPTKS